MTDRASDPTPISVVVVDDQDLVRSGFSTTINAQSDLAVVGEARDGLDALGVIRDLRPAVVLMDIRMPVMDGLEAAEIICADETLRATRVMMVTTFDTDDNIFAALKVGVGGFIGKDAAPQTLVHAIRTLNAGVGLVFPDETRALIFDHLGPGAGDPKAPTAIGLLTDREHEVFELVAQGLTNDEIGASLFIGKSTVKTHLNRCFSKLGVRDRAQMVILAYESGVLSPGSG